MKSDPRSTATEAETTPGPLPGNGPAAKQSGSTPAPTGPERGSRCDGAPESARPLTIINAIAAGWRPDRRRVDLKTYACSAGCGRRVMHYSADPTCGYTCPYCREQAAAFLGRKKKRKKSLTPQTGGGA